MCGPNRGGLARIISNLSIDPTLHEDLLVLFKSTKSKGMGAGLCLSQSIVTLHCGLLSLQSASYQGAVFSLTLPSHENVRAS